MFKIPEIKFKLFEVKQGRIQLLPTLNQKYLKTFFIISIVTIIIVNLASALRLDEKDLWKIYNTLLTHFGLQQKLPDIKDNEKALEAKIEVNVDQAIRNYWKEIGKSPVEVYKPRYIEESNDESVCYTDECKSLAPPMRLCAPWVDSCPKN